MSKKKEKPNLVKVPFGIVGVSLSTGLVGTQFNSPGMIKASAASNKFIPIAIDISMGGSVIKTLRNIKK